LLKELVNICSSVNTEVSLYLDKDGLTARYPDPAHVQMLDLTIPPSAFGHYSVPEDTVLTLDIDLIKDFINIFPKGTARTTIYMVGLREKDGKKNITHLTHLSMLTMDLLKDKDRLVSIIPLCLGGDIPKAKWPSLTLPTVVVIDPVQLCEAVRYVRSISNNLVLIIEYRPGKMSLTSFNDRSEGGHMERCYTFEPPALDPENDVPARSVFPIDYFQSMAQAMAHTDSAIVHMSNDMPMVIEGTTRNGIVIKMALAPRIEKE
jgi:hypothetical protein